MPESAIDISKLPDQEKAEVIDSQILDYVRSRMLYPASELRQDETPSFIKKLWRDITEPDWESRRSQSAISMTIARETGESPSKTEPPGIYETARQGFRQSVLGLQIRQAFDDKELESISQEAIKRMGPVQRSLYQAAMLSGDLPYMAIGGALGGGPSSPITAVGGAFALPAGLRKVYTDMIYKGRITSFRDFWDRTTGAVYETLKGEATGIATGKIGLQAGAFKMPAEIVTMVSVGNALEGKIPEPTDFIDAAIIIGGLKLSSMPSAEQRTAIKDALINIYKKTGKDPKTVLKDAEKDTSILDDIIRYTKSKLAEERGSLGGMLAKTAPKTKLSEADKLYTKGKTDAEVWEATGWMKEPSGKWTFRIDDSDAKFKIPKENMEGKTFKLHEVLDHKKLFDAYPQLKDVDVEFYDGTGGSYADGKMLLSIFNGKEEALHEVQHAVQDIEGFARGGSPTDFLEGLKFTDQQYKGWKGLASDLQRFLSPSLKEIEKSGFKGQEVIDELEKFMGGLKLSDEAKRIYLTGDKVLLKNTLRNLEKKIEDYRDKNFSNPEIKYRNLAGEISAREAGAGFQGTPFTMEGIPRDQWIVRDSYQGTSFSIEEPPNAERIRTKEKEKDLSIPEAYQKDIQKVSDEPGGGGQTKQRKFLKTVAEAEKTEPELVTKVEEINPQDYVVQPNAESLALAEDRIKVFGTQNAMDYVLSDAELGAEKGATFITLMDKFQKEGDYDRALQMVEAYDMQLREAGRFVQAASIWGRTSPQGFLRWAEKQLEATRSKYSWLDSLFNRKPESFTFTPQEKKEILQEMNRVNQMPDGIDKTDAILQQIDKVAQKVPPSVNEIIDAYRYQNMLSGPRTQMRNIGENLFNTFITKPIDITTRGAFDWIKSGLSGKEREAYVKDVPVYIKAAVNALPNALNAFMDVWNLKKGSEIGKPDIGLDVKSEFQKARTKQIPKSLTIVGRFMEASDKFFQAIIGAGEFALKKKEGFSDEDAYRAGAELAEKYLYRGKLDPNDPSLSYMSQVLEGFGKLMENSRQYPVLGKLSGWLVPFLRTPINKGVQMVDRSFLTFLRNPKAFRNPEIMNEVLSKEISGSILTGIGAFLAMTGNTTWAPPSDPKEKELFYATGRKPFSVKMGDKWIPLWYTGPFALALGLPAAIKHYGYDENKAMIAGTSEKLINIAQGIVRFVGSQTSTQSMGALFSALAGEEDFTLPGTIAFSAGQFIPASALIRYINTMIDPVFRKPEGFIEQFKKDLPILSKDLMPITDPMGQIVKRETINFFIPYDVGTVEPKFEGAYKGVSIENKYKYLESKRKRSIEKLIDKTKKGLNPEKSLKELDKILRATGQAGE